MDDVASNQIEEDIVNRCVYFSLGICPRRITSRFFKLTFRVEKLHPFLSQLVRLSLLKISFTKQTICKQKVSWEVEGI